MKTFISSCYATVLSLLSNPKQLSDAQSLRLRTLKGVIESGPIIDIHGAITEACQGSVIDTEGVVTATGDFPMLMLYAFPDANFLPKYKLLWMIDAYMTPLSMDNDLRRRLESLKEVIRRAKKYEYTEICNAMENIVWYLTYVRPSEEKIRTMLSTLAYNMRNAHI